MQNVSKSFVLHLQNSTQLTVLKDFNLRVMPGECVRLSGPSGMGKSTVLKLAFGNYQASSGNIWIRTNQHAMLEGGVQLNTAIDITQADAREILNLRSTAIGYVSQFLRVIPRVSALDVVAEPLLELGSERDFAEAEKSAFSKDQAREIAASWLQRLRIPESLWQLPPATFSGGEQQRINIARSFIKTRPLLL